MNVSMKELFVTVLRYKEGKNALLLILGSCLVAIVLAIFCEQTGFVRALEMGLSVLLFMATTRFAKVVSAVYEVQFAKTQNGKKGKK